MLGLLGLCVLLGTADEAPAGGDDVGLGASSVLIRPFNYDPADPWEYSRRRGVRSPESLIASTTWNRPPEFPLRTTRATSPGAGTSPIGSPSVAIPDLTALRTVRIGWSVRGIPITMHVYGSEAHPLLIFAAIHGDEPNTAGVTQRLIEHLDTHPDAYRQRGVVVIPVANPDGLARQTRGNAREVDVNRNFPARNWQPSQSGRYHGGTAHSSEPETQLLIKTIELLEPRGVISLHAIRRGRHGNNFDGPGEDLAKLLSSQNGYRVLKTIGYPTPGSFGSWAGVDRAIPTVTLELPSDLDSDAAWRENRAALLKAIANSVEQTGPHDRPRASARSESSLVSPGRTAHGGVITD